VQGRLQGALSAYFSGARDDSTFLGGSDAFFGDSLLLPNQGLDPSFQKWDASGAYQVHPRLRAYVSLENLFNADYAASFGYPSLPLTARAGVSVTLGGDR
jgi:vitamin B12 transporter